MVDEPSIVARTERAYDDFINLWERRRWLCLLVVAIIVVPAVLSVYLKWVAIPGLKAEILAKDTEIIGLHNKVTSIEHERDKAQIELAPYHAMRQRSFPDVPPDKGTDLLLARLELAVQSLQDVAAVLSGDRKIGDEVKKAMIADLKMIPPMNIIIQCNIGDREADDLGRQIRGIFEEAGWRIKQFGSAIYSTPPKPLSMIFKKPPSPQLQRVVATLLNNFGYPRAAYTDPSLDENDIKIIVGSK